MFQAYQRRFPTCPHVPDLLDSEITEEEETKDKSFHKIVRRCKINVEAPYLVKKVSFYFFELCLKIPEVIEYYLYF